METSLSDSILTVCKALNTFSVEYIIVGGVAVALHGYYRPSTNLSGDVSEKPDLDISYNPTYEDYFKLLKALKSWGQDVTNLMKEKAPDPRRIFLRYEYEKFTLDILPELKASLKFDTCYRTREVIKYEKR